MPIDPQIQQALDALAKAPAIDRGDLEALRALHNAPPQNPAPVASVEDTHLPGPAGELSVRLYRPAERTPGLILYFHGGGWVLGNLDSHDAPLRRLANATGCTIASVDYRLAPEHPFPAAVEDARAALHWADGQREALTGSAGAPLVVMGDSAGGNLAAVAAIMARDEGGPSIACQVLIYPAVRDDETRMPAFTPPLLTRQEMKWFRNRYVTPAQRSDWRFAPALSKDLSNLPPALVLTAEYDLLAPEGLAYAAQLNEAGGRARHIDYTGGVHGFFSLCPDARLTERLIEDIRLSLLETLPA